MTSTLNRRLLLTPWRAPPARDLPSPSPRHKASAATAPPPPRPTSRCSPGRSKTSWESLGSYQTPEWFRDAKFGIWAHWGPQCEPEVGDWYAREMYLRKASPSTDTTQPLTATPARSASKT